MPKVPEHETENNAETTEGTVPAVPTLDEVAGKARDGCWRRPRSRRSPGTWMPSRTRATRTVCGWSSATAGRRPAR